MVSLSRLEVREELRTNESGCRELPTLLSGTSSNPVLINGSLMPLHIEQQTYRRGQQRLVCQRGDSVAGWGPASVKALCQGRC